VILEPLFRRQSGHADVVAGFAVSARVAQVDDVNGVVPRAPSRFAPCR
jgi:hypothetical protein